MKETCSDYKHMTVIVTSFSKVFLCGVSSLHCINIILQFRFPMKCPLRWKLAHRPLFRKFLLDLCLGREGEDTRVGQKENPGCTRSSAEPTRSSEAEKAIRVIPTLQQRGWAFCMDQSLCASCPRNRHDLG
jgi:hypothetical protein